MRIAVVADGEGGGWIQELDGTPGPVHRVSDLAGAVRRAEEEGRTEGEGHRLGRTAPAPASAPAPGSPRAEPPRWVWAASEDVYPDLVRAGARVSRCHDAALTEALLLGHDVRHAEPHAPCCAYT